MIAVLFVLLLFGIHWLSYHPRMRIGDVSVRGAIMQNPEEITAYARDVLQEDRRHFIARDMMFFYPKEALRAGVVRNFPRLKSVRVGRSALFSNHLIVNVDERVAFATWCTNTADAAERQCFVFDDTGLIFADAERAGRPELPYAFFGGVDAANAIGSVYLAGHLIEIRDLLQRMREARFVPSSVTVLDEKDFEMQLQNGFNVKASFGQSSDTIVHNLELVAVSPALRGKETALEYIDLRFGNRVYYKFKGEDAPTEESPEAAAPQQ